MQAGSFQREAVLLNPTYPKGDEFSDVAVLYDGKVLIFQCKAKGFTRSARIGEDFARLRADMQAGIRAAFDQAVRARNYIRGTETAVIRTEGSELHIDTKQITDIYLINVTLMPFHAVSFGRCSRLDFALKITGAKHLLSLTRHR